MNDDDILLLTYIKWIALADLCLKIVILECLNTQNQCTDTDYRWPRLAGRQACVFKADFSDGYPDYYTAFKKTV